MESSIPIIGVISSPENQTIYYGDISALGTPPQSNDFVKGTNLVCYQVQSYVNNTPNVTLSGGPWNSCISCQT